MLPHPPQRHPHLPDRRRARRSSRSARRRCSRCPRATCCCRRCGRTTSSTPRSTASRTATAGSRAAAAWCSCTPTTSRRSGSRTASMVDLVSVDEEGAERQAPAFRVVAYDQPRGCAAAYYPETNPLVPLDHTAEGSNQPAVQVGHRPARQDRRRRHGRAERQRRGHGDALGPRGREEAAAWSPSTSADAPAVTRLRDSGGVTNPERDPDEIVCATGAGRGRGDGAAGGAAGRAAGDARTPYPPAAAPVADRRVVLPRPLRARTRWPTPAACRSRRTRTPGCRP